MSEPKQPNQIDANQSESKDTWVVPYAELGELLKMFRGDSLTDPAWLHSIGVNRDKIYVYYNHNSGSILPKCLIPEWKGIPVDWIEVEGVAPATPAAPETSDPDAGVDPKKGLVSILDMFSDSTNVEFFHNSKYVGIEIGVSRKGWGFGSITLSCNLEKGTWHLDDERTSKERVCDFFHAAVPLLVDKLYDKGYVKFLFDEDGNEIGEECEKNEWELIDVDEEEGESVREGENKEE